MRVEEIKSPEDIKKLNLKQQCVLAKDIREFLIKSLSKTGGHLSSNLGIVEITMAMHLEFDSPKDHFIFDVGHQAYIHKILTGRAKKFDTLRQYKGLSGFLRRDESIHDVWEAGHAGTSISGGVGFKIADNLNKNNAHTIIVIGDGSLTNGMVWEALNHIIELNQKIIIIINDNGRSISKNIGAINKIFANVEIAGSYIDTKKSVKKVIKIAPKGKKIVKKISNIKTQIKSVTGGPRELFTTMGYKYFGIIDGHDLKSLKKTLKIAKKINSPIIIHIKTQKGKGYKYAEKCVTGRWHGVGKFNSETGEPYVCNKVTNSKFVANKILNLMGENENLVVVSAAMINGSELQEIVKKYPKRIYDVGIAEEHAVTMCAGLALNGKKAFLSIYSTFLQRGYDQLLHDVVRQNANIIIGIERAGITGNDGDTHQGLFDIPLMRQMPNMIIAHGKDENETSNLLDLANREDGAYAIRFSKGNILEVPAFVEKIKIGSWDRIFKGKKGCIISFGNTLIDIINIIEENNWDIEVINARFIKPIDKKMFKKILEKNKRILVVEESIIAGGFGSGLLEEQSKYINNKCKIQIHGIWDEFVQHGDIQSLKKEYSLDKKGIEKIIKKTFNI